MVGDAPTAGRPAGVGSAGTADRRVGIGSAGTADRRVGMGAEPTLGAPREWYSRGYLPHRDRPGLVQMITYRLADSLPAEAVARLETELHALPTERQDTVRRKRLEELADAGHGSCLLRVPQIAELVIENWRHYAGARYDLIAYVVMPNHVHALVRVYAGVSLPRIVQAWKGYTGKRIREFLAGIADRLVGPRAEPTLGAPRAIWHREYWDRFIRDETHFRSAVEYIVRNPVRAGLARRPEDWPWCQATVAAATEGSP